MRQCRFVPHSHVVLSLLLALARANKFEAEQQNRVEILEKNRHLCSRDFGHLAATLFLEKSARFSTDEFSFPEQFNAGNSLT